MREISRTRVSSPSDHHRPKGLAIVMDGENPRVQESSSSIVATTSGGRTEWVPQIFSSVPTLDDAASYISETKALLIRCFSDYTVSSSSKDCKEADTVKLLDGSSTSTDAPSIPDGTLMNSDKTIRQEALTLAQTSQNGLTGFSLFQGLMERARRTVRGSADDIGWMKHDPAFPPVEDGTGRFMEIVDDIRHGLHKLPNSMIYLLIPGLFSNHGPLYFVNTKTYFSKLGLTCHIAKIHSEASVEKNAIEIKECIEEIYWGSGKPVLLLGHSKGGIDAAAALSMYWTDLKDKVAGLAISQSPYGGSPIASDILREGQLGDYVNIRKMMEILICKVMKGDIQALEDLTYEKRKEFLRKHHLPRELPVVSFHTEASITPSVLTMLSQVAHADVPLSAGQPAKLPVFIPLGAAMAACAQLLQIRYGEKSDGVVTRKDGEIPGSYAVRPSHKMDHGWMVYSSMSGDNPKEANSSQLCEALLSLLVEVGQKKRVELSMKEE
ncbi:uncharacterized protein LOC124938107 [Impatiens glandulifera]|uniref:uncharacterized protein LOC124938107 n=1 Tax=Impatiens glandulifera TaxID=253017 RepID=UPI001FB06709|nr:uncharacterized protein LOC124938107 [Impatiens glandulifera]